MELRRIDRLPPYVFQAVDTLKMEARRAGEDIIDLGMGNPDIPTPAAIVAKLAQAAADGRNHRYSASKGIPGLRKAMAAWYDRRFAVELDPETEVVATIGAKEGLAHLAWVLLRSGDAAFVPEPSYPIHIQCAVLAGADITTVPMNLDATEIGGPFLEALSVAWEHTWPRPRVLLCCFPHNPTAACVDRGFFTKLVAFAREKDLFIVHDFAYADIVYDGYRAPSILEVPGAKEVAVEFYSLSKSYSMAGWRVGFCSGNAEVLYGLARLKSYLDYGIFQPVQIAAAVALNEHDEVPPQIRDVYQRRRDVLCDGLQRAGWPIRPPKATMFVWARIPERFAGLGSVEFAKLLLREAKVAVSPGVGFGVSGAGHVRFALVENEERIRQALRGIRKLMA
jgi:alanine-synthesizing transaminase